MWDTRSAKILHEFAASHAAADKLAFSPDGRRLAFGFAVRRDARRFVRVWELGVGSQIAMFPAHLEAVWDMAYTRDGQTLATGSADSTAKLWNLDDIKQPRFVLRGRLLPVNSLAFSPDDRRLVVSGDSGETKLHGVRSGQEVATLKGSDVFVHYTFFADDDTLLTHAR